MTVTVVGVLADKLGAASQLEAVAVNHPGRNFDVRQEFFSVPSTEYRSVQATRIPVDLSHGPLIGQVQHLELTPNGRLYAISEIDGDALDEGPWYYSPEICHRNGRDIELRSLALTTRPASICLPRLQAFPGQLSSTWDRSKWQLGPLERSIIENAAADAAHRREHGGPIIVAAAEHDNGNHNWHGSPIAAARSRTRPMWIRSGGTIISVK